MLLINTNSIELSIRYVLSQRVNQIMKLKHSNSYEMNDLDLELDKSITEGGGVSGPRDYACSHSVLYWLYI